MSFLRGKIDIPEIFIYGQANGSAYLLMEYVEGKMLRVLLENNESDRESLIYNLGHTLRKIHDIKLIEKPDCNNTLSRYLSKAKFNMDNNLLDLEEFTIDGTYIEPKELLEYLTRQKIKETDVCLLHGDFRPKNIIYGDKITVIDWGFCDTGDAYYDL